MIFIACFYFSHFYEKEAFLMDEERASMLPMIAAGEKRETLPVFTTA